MSHNHETTAVGQVWEDRKGNRRQIIAILHDGEPLYSWADVPDDKFRGRVYDVVWVRTTGKRIPKQTWCATWETWVKHATLVQEDS
jgi:hypothetical protein